MRKHWQGREGQIVRVIDGPMTTRAFEAYVAQVLVPTLRPGQIVVLDNLSVHTSQQSRVLIEAHYLFGLPGEREKRCDFLHVWFC